MVSRRRVVALDAGCQSRTPRRGRRPLLCHRCGGRPERGRRSHSSRSRPRSRPCRGEERRLRQDQLAGAPPGTAEAAHEARRAGKQDAGPSIVLETRAMLPASYLEDPEALLEYARARSPPPASDQAQASEPSAPAVQAETGVLIKAAPAALRLKLCKIASAVKEVEAWNSQIQCFMDGVVRTVVDRNFVALKGWAEKEAFKHVSEGAWPLGGQRAGAFREAAARLREHAAASDPQVQDEVATKAAVVVALMGVTRPEESSAATCARIASQTRSDQTSPTCGRSIRASSIKFSLLPMGDFFSAVIACTSFSSWPSCPSTSCCECGGDAKRRRREMKGKEGKRREKKGKEENNKK